MDEHGFEQRVLALENRLYRIACAMLFSDADAADALQEAILKAWRRLSTLKDDSRFDAWLTSIVVNESKTILRKKKRQPMPVGDLPDTPCAPPEDKGLQAALMRLPEKYRMPLLLHHLDGYDIADVARVLRLPQTTVKGRLYEARKRLRVLLKGEEDAE